MTRWIALVVPALMVSVVAVTGHGLAQEKDSISKGTRESSASTSDARGSLTTINRSGVPVTVLGADDEGDGALNISDSTGERKVALRVGEIGGSLHVFGPGGQESASLETNDTGGVLWVTSADGTLVAHLGVDSDGGAFWVSNNAGDSVTFVGADSDGEGVFWVSSAAGESRATLGVDADGGFLRVDDNADETVVLIAADSGGGAGFISVSGERVHDVAEVFDLETRDGVVPGSVMSVDALGSGALMPAAAPYDRKVVGVISGAGGFQHAMLIGSREDGSHDLPVALSGQVHVRVSAENGPISPGDFLVSSSSPGVAMAARDLERSIGAVVGKALQGFAGDEPEGLIRMLVMAR